MSWTERPESTAEQLEQMKLREAIFVQKNRRDQAISLALITLSHAHASSKIENSHFFDIVLACLHIVRHASEADTCRFLIESFGKAQEAEINQASMLATLEYMRQRCTAETASSIKAVKKLIKLVPNEEASGDASK